MTIKCHYCQRPCRRVNAGYASQFRYNWQCDYHMPIRVWHAYLDMTQFVELLVIHQSKSYKATFIFDPEPSKKPLLSQENS